MKVELLKRRFVFNGVPIPDPKPSASPEEVRSLLAFTYPDITTATASGPVIANGVAIYKFERQVGVKG